MGFLGQQYNTEELPEGRGFDPLPVGWYDADIIKTEMKQTKDGTGNRLTIQFKITGSVDGKYIGRVVFAGLNIDLPNSPKAEEIGRQQLGDMLRAIGLASVEDSDEIVGYSLRIRLRIREGTEDYPDAQNEVSGFKPQAGAVVDAPPAARPNGTAKPAQATARPQAASARPAPAARPQAAVARAATPAAAPAGAKKPPPWARKK